MLRIHNNTFNQINSKETCLEALFLYNLAAFFIFTENVSVTLVYVYILCVLPHLTLFSAG